MRKSLRQLAGLLIILPISLFSYGGEENMKVPTPIQNAFLLDGYALTNSVSGMMDGESVTTYRYQKSGPVDYFGEHISFVFTPSKKLKGLTRMTKDFEVSSQVLPTEKEAKDVATNFLATYAVDLEDDMDIRWIKPHDEDIYVNGKTHVITGMKVKCRNLTDGTYFWVIVGKDQEVIVFERDIIWNFIQGGRQTEKWLHDDWLVKNIRK